MASSQHEGRTSSIKYFFVLHSWYSTRTQVWGDSYGNLPKKASRLLSCDSRTWTESHLIGGTERKLANSMGRNVVATVN